MAVFSAIAAAIGSISAFIGSLGVVGGAILKAVVGIGLNKLAVKLSGKKASGPTFSVKGQLQRGADVPQSFLVGMSATAGSLTYANTWGTAGGTPNAYLTMVISLSDMPIQSLDAMWVNGEKVALDGVVHASYGTAVSDFNKGGNDHFWVKFYDGTQTAADSFLTETVADDERPWDAEAVGYGTAYAVVTVRINQELFNGFPQCLFEVTGVPLYDPSRDSSVGGVGVQRWDDPATWGGDGDGLPAVAVYNLFRGVWYQGQWFYGMQVATAAQLPVAHWITQINKCRAAITANDGPEPKFRAGGEISVGASIADAVEAFLDACQGRLTESGGIYKMFVGAPDAPVATFSDDDILSSEEQTFTPFFGLADTVNGVSAKFPDPEQGWQVETAPPLNRTDLEAEDGSRRLMVDVQFDLVPYAEQVQRLMLASLNEARRARRHTFTLPPRFWALEPGDVVSWSSVRNGYDAKLFRVDGVLDQPNADVVVDLTEIDPSDYDFNTLVDFTLPVRGSIIGSVVAPQVITGWAVQAWSIRDAASAPRMPAILVAWDGGVDDVSAVRVQVRLKATAALVFAGRFDDVSDGQGILAQGILPGVEYQVRGIFVPGTPRDVEWSDWLDVTTPDLRLKPEDVSTAVWEQIADDAAGQAEVVLQDFRSAEFTPAVTSLTAAQQTDRVDIDGILSRNDDADSRIDAVVIEQTRFGDALDTISEVATEAITLTSQTTSLVYDAGVRTDTETGEVYIYALRQQEGQLTTVEQRLDAAEGTLTQTATQIWVNSQIAAAQLDPAELAALDDLQLQVNTVEQELNAAQASITAKAEATFVYGLDVRLNTAETSLDALGLAIATKVESATFDAAVQRIQTAEETLDLIDVPTIRQQVSDIRRLSDDVDQLAYDSIEGLIDAYRAQDVLRTDFAIATQELQAGITDTNEAIATAKTELAAGILGNTAQLTQEAQARADADSAQASDIAALDVRLGDTETGLDTAVQAQQALEGRVTSTETGQTAHSSDITGLTTRIGGAETGLVAETQARTELTGRVETVEDGQTAQSAQLTALGTRIDDAETGQTAQGQALNQLTTRVDGAEGSISSQGAAITQIDADLQTAAGERQATVSALNTVTGRVDDAEGVLSAHGQSLTRISAELTTAEQERQANAQATQSLATDVSQLTDGFAPLSTYDLYLEARIDAAEDDAADADLGDAAQAELGRQNTREDLALARQQLQAGIDEQGVALASAREELTARIGDTDAQVLTESQARADGDSALASDLSQVVARVTDAEGDITAQAGQITSVQANVTNLDGQLAASVQSVTTLSAQVGGHETLIQEQAQAVAGLGGTVQYLINTNGHIAGWALTNQVENGDPFAAFTFLADKFQISSVDGALSPFIVYTVPTNVNGTVVPAGVYLKDAFIRNGIFDSAKIADVIQSANYQQGVAGWRILKSGQAEFNDIVLSRDQVIDSGVLNIGSLPGAGGALTHVGTWYAETNTATGAWNANPHSFYASVGRRPEGPGDDFGTIWSDTGYGTSNIQWGWSAEVVPITRWSGPQRLWIKIMFHARNVHNGTNFQVEWKLKRIT